MPENLRQAFVEDFSQLLQYCLDKIDEGYIDYYRMGETWRRKITQDWLFEQGWTHTHHSNHQDFRAGDLFFWKNGKQVKNTGKKINGKWEAALLIWDIGEFWESLSEYNRWGGHYITFCDVAHFEKLLDPRR